jgi:hypothetical protein
MLNFLRKNNPNYLLDYEKNAALMLQDILVKNRINKNVADDVLNLSIIVYYLSFKRTKKVVVEVENINRTHNAYAYHDILSVTKRIIDNMAIEVKKSEVIKYPILLSTCENLILQVLNKNVDKINNLDSVNSDLTDKHAKSKNLNEKWIENLSNNTKEILEIHVIFSIFEIDINFDSSIHSQYKKHFGSNYIFQDQIEYKPLLSLKKLNLRGGEDVENISFIQHLENIEELTYYCDSKRIQGTESIGTIVNLKKLHLFTPELTQLEFLKGNSQLKELSLITGKVNNYSFFTSLLNLKKLHVSIDNLHKNHPIFELGKIEELSVFCNNVQDLNDFVKFKNLKKLDSPYLTLDNNILFLKFMSLNKLWARKGNLTRKEIEWINENIEEVLLL